MDSTLGKILASLLGLLALAGVVVAGIVGYSHARTNSAVADVATLATKIRGDYVNNPAGYATLSNQVAIAAGDVPADMLQGSSIINAWGSAVTVGPVAGTPKDFAINLGAVPKAACVEILTTDGGLMGAMVGGKQVALPMSVADAATACASAANASGNVLVTAQYGQVSLSNPGVPTLSASSLTFPATTVGSTSSQTLTLQNTGGLPLTVSSVTSSAAMFSASTTCATLNAGQSCPIQVTFAPSATGPATATLTVATSSGNQSVSLAGSGAAASYTLDSNAQATYTYTGTGPWGVNYYGTWIWNTSGFTSSAPAGISINFESLVTNSTGAVENVKVFGSVDNNITGLSIDGTYYGFTCATWSPPCASSVIAIPPGTSVIHVQASNAGGPAGLEISVQDAKTGATLNSTSLSSWYWTTNAF